MFGQEPTSSSNRRTHAWWWNWARLPLIWRLVIGRRPQATAARGSAERMLAEEQDFQSLIKGVTGCAIITLDRSARITSWNAGAEILFGYRSDEVIGTSFYTSAPANDPPHLDPSLAQDGSVSYEEARVRKDGSRFLAQIALTRTNDVQGSLVGFAAIVRDITEERAAQQDLVRKEQRLRDAKELAGLGYWDLDPATGMGRASRNAAPIMGVTDPDGFYQLNEVMGRIPEEDRLRVSGELDATLKASCDQLELTHRKQKADVSTAWVHGRVRVQRNAAGVAAQLYGTIFDITSLKEAESARMAQARTEQRINQIVNTIREVLFEIDPAGRWVYLNPAWNICTGFTVNEALLQPVLNWIHPSFSEAITRDLGELLGGNAPLLRTELLIRTKQDAYRWMEIVAQQAANGVDGSKQIVGTLVDIHERKLAAVALKDARETAEEANRKKSEFLAIVSREMHAPLGALVGMSKVLCNAKLTQHERETAIAVRQSTQELLTVLNSLLDLSRFEAGLLRFNPVPVDIRLATEDVIESLCSKADRKRLDLALRYDPSIPKRVMTDPGRYRQLLSILVENAINYSNRGEIVLSVSTREIGVDTVDLAIEVQDSGSGLFPQHALKPELSLPSATRHEGKKLGLGLELAKHLLSFLNGRATVSSRPGFGTAICMRFTCTREEHEWPPPLPPDVLRSKKLLIVEPSFSIHAGLQSMLHGSDAQIAQVYDSEAALDLIQTEARFQSRFDAILYSTESVGLDWDDFAERLQQIQGAPSPALILLSRSTNMPGPAEMARVGCRYALRRNPSRQQLWTALVSALSGTGTEHSCGTQPRQGKPSVNRTRTNSKRVLLITGPNLDVTPIKAVLELSGCQYAVTRDRPEAPGALILNSFDLVLLDQAITEASLSEYTRLMRAAHPSAPTPLAIVTTDSDAKVSPGSKDLACEYLLPRRFSVDDLQELLTRVVRTREESVVFDRDLTLARCGEDWDLLAELAQDFRDNTSALSVALIKAVSVRDSAVATDCIEKLQAASRFFGALALCELLDEINGLVNLHDWAAIPRRLSSARLELNRLCSELPLAPSEEVEGAASC